MANDERFVQRWSRRKRAADRDAAPGSPAGPDEAAGADRPGPLAERESKATGPGPAEPGGARPERALNLPDIDALTAESDFTRFMHEGVPAELRNRALRKLWRLDPVFAKVDGLDDYAEDFTIAAAVLPDMKTLYKRGRDLVRGEGETADAGDAATRTADQDDAAAPADAAKSTTTDAAAVADERTPSGPPKSG